MDARYRTHLMPSLTGYCAYASRSLRIESDFDWFQRFMGGRLPSPLSNRNLRGSDQKRMPTLRIHRFHPSIRLHHNFQLHTALDAHFLSKSGVLGLHFPHDHPPIVGDFLATQISRG